MHKFSKKLTRAKVTETCFSWLFRMATYFIIFAAGFIFVKISWQGALTVFPGLFHEGEPLFNTRFLTEAPQTLRVFEPKDLLEKESEFDLKIKAHAKKIKILEHFMPQVNKIEKGSEEWTHAIEALTGKLASYREKDEVRASLQAGPQQYLETLKKEKHEAENALSETREELVESRYVLDHKRFMAIETLQTRLVELRSSYKETENKIEEHKEALANIQEATTTRKKKLNEKLEGLKEERTKAKAELKERKAYMQERATLMAKQIGKDASPEKIYQTISEQDGRLSVNQQTVDTAQAKIDEIEEELTMLNKGPDAYTAYLKKRNETLTDKISSQKAQIKNIQLQLDDSEVRGLEKMPSATEYSPHTYSYSGGGIMPAIVGTVLLVLGAIAIALFLGVFCAVYLSEYSKPGKLLSTIRLSVLNLAGVPSIVFGIFGYGMFVLAFGWNVSMIAGWFTLAFMALPLVIAACEESMRAIPKGFREGSLALGASKWTSIRTNVLPYAMPGILTSSIMSIARVAGETAPIMFTAAYALRDELPWESAKSIFDIPFQGVMALPYHIYVVSAKIPQNEFTERMQYGTAFIFLLIVGGLALCSILLRIKMRAKYRW